MCCMHAWVWPGGKVTAMTVYWARDAYGRDDELKKFLL